MPSTAGVTSARPQNRSPGRAAAPPAARSGSPPAFPSVCLGSRGRSSAPESPPEDPAPEPALDSPPLPVLRRAVSAASADSMNRRSATPHPGCFAGLSRTRMSQRMDQPSPTTALNRKAAAQPPRTMPSSRSICQPITAAKTMLPT